MDKRMFQILDEMNIADGENKTAHVGVCSDLVSANTAKGGGHVTIGVPAEIITRLAMDKNIRAVLLIIDYKEYDRVRQVPQPNLTVIEEWKAKAEKWDALEKKVSKFYVDENGDELSDDDGGDLADIGEAAAIAFGYL